MAEPNNGKPPAKQEVMKPLKESRRGMYEAGLRAFHETAQEVEELKAEIERQRQDLKAKEMEIASLTERLNTMRDDHASALSVRDSREHDLQAQRDLAVSETAALKTLVASIRKLVGLADRED